MRMTRAEVVHVDVHLAASPTFVAMFGFEPTGAASGRLQLDREVEVGHLPLRVEERVLQRLRELVGAVLLAGDLEQCMLIISEEVAQETQTNPLCLRQVGQGAVRVLDGTDRCGSFGLNRSKNCPLENRIDELGDQNNDRLHAVGNASGLRVPRRWCHAPLSLDSIGDGGVAAKRAHKPRKRASCRTSRAWSESICVSSTISAKSRVSTELLKTISGVAYT